MHLHILSQVFLHQSLKKMGSPLFSFVFILIMLTYILGSFPLPFVVIHGIGQDCSDKKVFELTKQLGEWSETEGYCIESSYGRLKSWLIPLHDQTTTACNKVKEMQELKQGYHIVGLSQGTLVARGIIEFCDGAPPVKNFISIAGPQAGTVVAPCCLFRYVYTAAAKLVNFLINRQFIQNHFAASGYFKIPIDIPAYREHSRFLSKLNNDIPNQRNLTYKERFKSLENLVLIKFDNEDILNPKETAWFGCYSEGSFDSVLPAHKTELYIEDWIGLKALDKEGKVKYITFPGNHLNISYVHAKKYIVPYLRSQYSRPYNEKTTQLLPYVEPNQILKLNTRIVSKGSGAHRSKHKTVQLLKETTPRVVHIWKPTILKVKRQCLIHKQKIRR